MQMKMQMKMSQQLIMTPQLQQAIKLLQLSRAELEELIPLQLQIFKQLFNSLQREILAC